MSNNVEALEDHAWRRRLHSLDALECAQEIARLQRELKLREAELRIAIAGALDPNGKPAFSNETRREAEFIKRCEEDSEIKSIRDKIQTLVYGREKARIEAQYHADMMVVMGGDLHAHVGHIIEGVDNNSCAAFPKKVVGESGEDDGDDA